MIRDDEEGVRARRDQAVLLQALEMELGRAERDRKMARERFCRPGAAVISEILQDVGLGDQDDSPSRSFKASPMMITTRIATPVTTDHVS